MVKKLVGSEALVFKKILNSKENKTVIDLEGDLFVIQPLEKDNILYDIENDHELKKMLKRADKDILEGRLFSSDELLEAIELGEI